VKQEKELIKSDARDIALRAIESFRRKNAWPDYLLRAYIEKGLLSKNDSALARRIVSGVIQNRMLLDYYISYYSKPSLKKVHPTVLDILRMSVYQLVFFDKIPHNAIVNEGVRLTKKYSTPQAAGYVNAVLRKISTDVNEGKLTDVNVESEEQRLSVNYSHPEWLVGEFIDSLGAFETEKLLKINNSVDTTVYAQVNTLKVTTEKLLLSLKKDALNVEKHKWLDDCVVFSETPNISGLSAFKEGFFYVQNPASRLAVYAAGIKPGDLVIDGCSAPGGKAFASAITMKNTGSILAFDLKLRKIQEIKRGTARLGINIIKASMNDSSKPDERLIGIADIVLADVPCSGFGVISKKPEIRYKSEHSISGLPDIQKQILGNLALYVKPGGVLLYSTCTVLKRENEDVIGHFLDENKAFITSSFSLPGIGEVKNGKITLWPHLHGTDGFFICKLKRQP